MTFEVYLALATLAILVLRWLLFLRYEQRDGGPSFLMFMLDPKSHPENGHIRTVILILFAALAAFGLYAFP